MKGKSLVLESQIGHTSACNIITIQEAKWTQSIGNAGRNDRLSNVDRVLNNEG
jgi:hypothetical protein